MPWIEDGPQSELPGLAGRHRVYQNDLSWNICSLTRLSFSLSSPLLSFQASHHSSSCSSSPCSPLLPCCEEQPSSGMHSHICLMGPHQDEPLTPASSFLLFVFLPPSSQPQGLCYQAFSLCPTLVDTNLVPLVNRKCPRVCTWIRPLLLAPSSGMHDELWNPFPDKFRISGSARALDQWMGTRVTNQKILYGKCLWSEICSLLTVPNWKPNDGSSGVTWKQTIAHLYFKYRDCLRFSLYSPGLVFRHLQWALALCLVLSISSVWAK